MNNHDKVSISKMKENISKAGGLFYQYRACKRDAAIIYDVENIMHDVVYARTPLHMNDPFDSMLGFSVEEIHNECIDFAFEQINTTWDSNIKIVVKNLLKYRISDESLVFFNALNKLKKYIFTQSIIANVPSVNLSMFIIKNLNKLYAKCPTEIKKYFNKDAFYVFALLIKDYQNEDIEEKTIVKALKMEDVFEELEDAVIKIRDEVFIPSYKNFLSKLTVTCFSASGWDNQLMWAHYADSYSGVCVEYDFDKMDKFIGYMSPVKYSTVRPTLSFKDLGLLELKKDANGDLITTDVDINVIYSYLLTKNKCWSYEEEWRIINFSEEPYTPLFLEAPFVKSITLGFNIDDMCKQLLWDMCKERKIECYQLVINYGDYSLSRKLLTDEDFVFDKEKEERYIFFICEQLAPLAEKVCINCASLTNSIKEGDLETTSMINMLTFTLDYLSDAYFLKTSFNRFFKYTEAFSSEVISDTQFDVAIVQIDSVICKSETGVEMLDNLLINLRIINGITENDYSKAKKLINNINEMYENYRKLNWYGKKFDK